MGNVDCVRRQSELELRVGAGHQHHAKGQESAKGRVAQDLTVTAGRGLFGRAEGAFARADRTEHE